MHSDYTIPVWHHTKNFTVIIDQEYWKSKEPVFPEDVLTWFADGFRVDSGKRGWYLWQKARQKL
jgi:hypothetical protein